VLACGETHGTSPRGRSCFWLAASPPASFPRESLGAPPEPERGIRTRRSSRSWACLTPRKRSARSAAGSALAMCGSLPARSRATTLLLLWGSRVGKKEKRRLWQNEYGSCCSYGQLYISCRTMPRVITYEGKRWGELSPGCEMRVATRTHEVVMVRCLARPHLAPG
jgi:hypothetical protein